MSRNIDYLPRIAIFLAGVVAGALTGRRRDRVTAGMDPAEVLELKNSLASLETRVTVQETTSAQRFTQIEARLDDHAAKLSEIPSTNQIVTAMEGLLSKTMASLDERLNTQAQSIEVLKTTVSQTDSLLERVLESLDALQTYTGADLPNDVLSRRSAGVS
jgi:uncharacterized coiled-coil protein SlyX